MITQIQDENGQVSKFAEHSNLMLWSRRQGFCWRYGERRISDWFYSKEEATKWLYDQMKEKFLTHTSNT